MYCNPNRPHGEVCGNKKARLAGMFCPTCQENVHALLDPTNITLNVVETEVLQGLWNTHLSRVPQERQHNRNANANFRAKNGGADER